MHGSQSPWKGSGATKGRIIGGMCEFVIHEVTTQSRMYKKKLDQLLRTELKIRPRYGEFEVEIMVDVHAGYPAIDLDNVAKAVLDGIKGAVYFDDAQVMRLLVEKRWAEVECVRVKVWLRQDCN
ncbi:RusA family crossover junction endodeoxyribonuclease [Candidatus Phycosocius spiralis]|nr:RusA family crossover junction endodeoxyribonuclease [Candidatus Phycosocius spiralis]